MERDFYWGASTSAYQIEGAHLEDGKGLSIWDVFSKKRGKIQDGTHGDTACDHYHRYREDVDLMQALDLNAYRFSISWPRVMPTGIREVNSKGLDFYDRLVDTLLSKGITPFATLYHFDLPYELSRQGGWYNRDTAQYFAEYTEVVLHRLSDRVKHWMTLNEPLSIGPLGYYTGHHAPGKRNIFKGPQVIHHMLLAHGYSMERIRSMSPDAKAGLVNIFYPPYPFRPGDTKAVQKADALNRLFMDPVYKGEYPDAGWLYIPGDKTIRDGDMKLISQPMDFLGVNVYTRTVVKNTLLPTGFFPVKPSYEGARYTAMGWEVYPQALYEILKWVQQQYHNPQVLVTENGAAYTDKLENGRVHDPERIEFLKAHIAQMEKARSEGANVGGYFVWSLMDNFEWAFGLAKRFGLIYVDYQTGRRVIKDSGHWYADVCRQGGLQPETSCDSRTK